MQDHAFHLHKGDFRDALSLRYSLLPLYTAKTCHCRTSFSVDHAMVCPFGGFPTFRHNEVHDLTATLLTEVCHNVATEPPLQPITAETFPYATVNTADDAHLDVKARGFWCRGQDAFFDVCVFYPNASSYCTLGLSFTYKCHEDVKKREYGNRVREVEHGVFTPLVFTSTGDMGWEAITFYERLADLRTCYPLRTTLQYHNSLAKVPHVLCPALFYHLVYSREPVFHTQPCSGTTRLVSGLC